MKWHIVARLAEVLIPLLASELLRAVERLLDDDPQNELPLDAQPLDPKP